MQKSQRRKYGHSPDGDSYRRENLRGHYMNPALLDSQFETLEEPERDWQVDISLKS
jgi:gluconate kinase